MTKIRMPKDSSPESENLYLEEISNEENKEEEQADESFVQADDESVVVEEEEEEELSGSDFRPEFKHAPVDVSGFPEFMVRHLQPMNKWSTNIASIHNARLRWFKKATEYLKVFFAIGLPKAEIKRRLGIGDSTYDTLEARLMEKDGAKFLSMSVAQRYFIYVLQMEACIRMLNYYVEHNIEDSNDKKANIVQAVKTIAGIHKDVLLTGRDLGIIDVQKGKGPRMLGEINLAALDTDTLKTMFENKFRDFKKLINDSTTLSGPYARLLLEQKKKVFEMKTEGQKS